MLICPFVKFEFNTVNTVMCTNPNLMRVFDIPLENKIQMCPRLEELGWKIDHKRNKAYKFIPHRSRDMPLEEIPEYINQQLIDIDCGGCIECRLKYSKDWANRCHLESLSYSHNYFLTLTYDDEHVVPGKFGNYTIVKEHITDFIHKLRDKFRYKFDFVGIRYFGCQEYGENSFRPHAHLILFNCPIPDITIDIKDKDGQVIHKRNKLDGTYYLWSQFVKDCWDYGNILLADCNWNTSAYVSRYVLKKIKGEEGKQVYNDKLGVEPPYLFMSRKPGIGCSYLDAHVKDLIDDPHLYIPKRNGCLISSPPRYFLKKVKDSHPEFYDDYLSKVSSSIDSQRSLLVGKTTINNQRINKEHSLNSKFQAFHRDID